MNQFEYFTEIEEAFVRLRGKSLLLSPMDWDLMQSWKDDGVPLRVVLRSLEKVFESHQAKARRRPIQSLSYCKGEVEAQFGEWREARVGAAEPEASTTGSSDSNPFGKDAVLAHLERSRVKLLELKIKRAEAMGGGFVIDVTHIALCEAIARLGVLIGEFEKVPNAEKLENELGLIERSIDEAIDLATFDDTRAEARAAAVELLKPYKSNMEPEVYERQIELLLKKRLREIYGVPRLSLFYL
jgi:hypothetical protein